MVHSEGILGTTLLCCGVSVSTARCSSFPCSGPKCFLREGVTISGCRKLLIFRLWVKHLPRVFNLTSFPRWTDTGPKWLAWPYRVHLHHASPLFLPEQTSGQATRLPCQPCCCVNISVEENSLSSHPGAAQSFKVRQTPASFWNPRVQPPVSPYHLTRCPKIQHCWLYSIQILAPSAS